VSVLLALVLGFVLGALSFMALLAWWLYRTL